MGSKKAKEPTAAQLYAPAQAASQAAAVISPEEQEVKTYNKKLWDIYSGKQQFDIKNMPNSNILMPMYQNARQLDKKRSVGQGLALAGDGYNANHIAAIGEQNALENQINAKGMLEQRVADTFGGLEGKMMGFGQSDQARREGLANRNFQFYNVKANQPKKPKWYEQLLGGAFQMGSAALSNPEIMAGL